MKRAVRRMTAAAVASGLAAVAALAAPATAGAHPLHRDGLDHAVLVQTDNPAGNQIVAYDRAEDGTLTLDARYDTGGRGGALKGAAVDPLASQGSLVYDAAHRLLYALNAGSDSVTVFSVDGDRLYRRQIVAAGPFPVSVAVHGDLVYVLDATGAGSVRGFRVEHGWLERIEGSSRSLGLTAVTDATQFLNTPGQVAFTPDGRQLVVTTKKNPATGATPGRIDVFGVRPNGRLTEGFVANPSQTGVPFGVVFDPSGRLVVAEAGGNALATYTVGPDRTLTPVAARTDSQAALCWVAVAGDNYYVANAGSATVTGFHVDAAGTPLTFTQAGTDPGTIDLAATAHGRFLYVEAGAHGNVDGFRVNPDGSLTSLPAVAPLGAGIEGIVAG